MFKKFLAASGVALAPGSAVLPQAAMAVTPGYYAPFDKVSNNIECKIGHPYNKQNMQNGTCRVNWNTVTESTIKNMIDSAVTGLIPQKQQGKKN